MLRMVLRTQEDSSEEESHPNGPAAPGQGGAREGCPTLTGQEQGDVVVLLQRELAQGNLNKPRSSVWLQSKKPHRRRHHLPLGPVLRGTEALTEGWGPFLPLLTPRSGWEKPVLE